MPIQLRSKLERSRDQQSSRCSSPQQSVHFHTHPSPVNVHNSCGEQLKLHVLHELEQERQSRQRLATLKDINNIQKLKSHHRRAEALMQTFVDASFKGHLASSAGSDKVTSELSQQLRSLCDEVNVATCTIMYVCSWVLAVVILLYKLHVYVHCMYL